MATGTYLRLIPAMEGWSEQVLCASVDRAKLLGAGGVMPTPGVSTYKDCSKFLAGNFSDKYKTWLFLKPGNDDGRADYTTWNFAAPRPAGKPVPFRTTPGNEMRDWPMVITKMEVTKNRMFPHSANILKVDPDDATNNRTGLATTHQLHLQLTGIAPGSYATLIQKREYLSPVKFQIPRTPEPIPQLMQVDYIGLQERIPESLHDDIFLEDQRAVVASLYNGDAGALEEGPTGGRVPGRFFPRTNFTRWAPYFHMGTPVQLPSGMWYLAVELRFPPSVTAIPLN